MRGIVQKMVWYGAEKKHTPKAKEGMVLTSWAIRDNVESSTRRVAQRQSTHDPCSSSERGIRQVNNHRRGSTTSTFMTVGKQETALGSNGGSSVTF